MVTDSPAFGSAATTALRAWTFRPALRSNREAASRLYVVVLFVGDIAPLGDGAVVGPTPTAMGRR